MATIDVWLTVVHGVADTTVKDFHRSERVFVHVPLRFKVKKFTLNKDQMKAILGTDGKLALTGGTERVRPRPSGWCRQPRRAPNNRERSEWQIQHRSLGRHKELD